MEDRKRQRRQEQLRRLDAWLQKPHQEHPILHWLLAIGIAVAVLAVAMLLRWLLEPR
jgi:hypothetical protein